MSAMYSSKPGQYLDQNMPYLSSTMVPTMGGWAMNRNYSDQSSTSTQSRSSGDFSSVSSGSPSMSYDLRTPQSLQYCDDDYSQNQEYDNHTVSSSSIEKNFSVLSSSVKSTPSTLGWSSKAEQLSLYKFIVPKGKEPYFELLPGYQVCYNTPHQIFLDPSSSPQNGVYPCQYPIGCLGKEFRRPADLERHYRNVHADPDQKANFACDYKPCSRSTDPFTRKDHYRDHLKDFHKEDIGTARQPKKSQDLNKWQADQQSWLEERQINPRWWRCKRCLQRVYVEVHGYKCTTCNEECAKDRIEAREQKRQESGSEQTQYSEQDMDLTYTNQCTSCNGSMWIMGDAFGSEGSVPCPICMPSGELVYEDADWEVNARFDSSYGSTY